MNLGIPAARLAAPAQARKYLFPVNTLACVERRRGLQQFRLQFRRQRDVHNFYFRLNFPLSLPEITKNVQSCYCRQNTTLQRA